MRYPPPRNLLAAPAAPFAALMAGGVALLLAACSEPATAPVTRATPVRTAAAWAGPSQPPVTANGLVAARDELRLSFKVGGVIRSIAVREGETVRRGQVLAEIELAEVGSQVEQARQLADKAQRDLERGERLHADQVISLEQLQDLRTQSQVARAALRAASFNLGQATIVAPRDGIVLRRLGEEREVVPAGQPVVVLGARDGGYIVKVALADRDVVRLSLGDAASITMDAYPGRTLQGSVAQIAGAAEERSGLFPIEIRIDDAPAPLASGLVAKVTLAPRAAAASTLTYVPIAAIVEGDRDRAFVYTIEDERARRRPVRIAFLARDAVALSEGVAPGERVVTDGALYLQDGEPLRIVEDAAQAVGSVAPLLPAGSAG